MNTSRICDSVKVIHLKRAKIHLLKVRRLQAGGGGGCGGGMRKLARHYKANFVKSRNFGKLFLRY